jgi:isochorismate hydrolase
MTQNLKIDREKTAVLIMDFQQRMINNTASDPEDVVKKAAQVLAGARGAGIPVIYVIHRGGGLIRIRTGRGTARRCIAGRW